MFYFAFISGVGVHFFFFLLGGWVLRGRYRLRFFVVVFVVVVVVVFSFYLFLVFLLFFPPDL